MAISQHDASPRRRSSVALAAALLALVAIIALPATDPGATAEAASHRPLAVIVVGPVGSATPAYLRDARRIAAQLRSYGSRVREIYSPWATWARVKDAARGANLFVYLGHGNGYPSPYGRFEPGTMNGLGLNRSGGRGNRNVRYYGEAYLRSSLRLAPGAVVILDHVCYAAGGSEPGRTYPTRRMAARRADNFAAGFLAAGADAVFASDRSVATIVHDPFGARRTMAAVFWHSPWTSTRYDSTFASTRTRGASGILAPYGAGRYYQSVTGRLRWTTTDWRWTWYPPVAAPAAAPAPAPIPTAGLDPSPSPSPDPGVVPTPSPVDPSPTPDPSPPATPDPGAAPGSSPEPAPVP